MSELFNNYSALIVSLHVFSAIVWVGGMIGMRMTVHPSMQSIDDPKIKLGKTLEVMRRLLNMVIPMILILFITALFMTIGLGFKGNELYITILIKEGIWTVMTIVFIFIYIKRYKAEKLFHRGELAAAKEMVKLIPNLLLPINIFLGLVALYLGVVLRGF